MGRSRRYGLVGGSVSLEVDFKISEDLVPTPVSLFALWLWIKCELTTVPVMHIVDSKTLEL